MSLDALDTRCLPIRSLLGEPIVLEALLPGVRIFCAWLKAEEQDGRFCSTFTITRNESDPNPLDIVRTTSQTKHCTVDELNCSTSSIRKQYFDQIYRDDLWAKSPNTLKQGPRSGHGSTLRFTANIREVLLEVLEIPRTKGAVQQL